ncbi:35136_t:CDS:1, partial [Racocetra persica]
VKPVRIRRYRTEFASENKLPIKLPKWILAKYETEIDKEMYEIDREVNEINEEESKVKEENDVNKEKNEVDKGENEIETLE